MTRWVVIFDDTPAMLAVRKARGADHIDYLKKHSDSILVGGGLRPVPDAPFVGGLWIVEAETHDAVIDLVVNDPYFAPEHRNFRICAWGKAIDWPVTL